MCAPVETVGKQCFDFRSAESTRRQTDAMQNDEFGKRAGGPLVEIAARHLAGRLYQAAAWINRKSGAHGVLVSGMIPRT